jgi:hypothetical protein
LELRDIDTITGDVIDVSLRIHRELAHQLRWCNAEGRAAARGQ